MSMGGEAHAIKIKRRDLSTCVPVHLKQKNLPDYPLLRAILLICVQFRILPIFNNKIYTNPYAESRPAFDVFPRRSFSDRVMQTQLHQAHSHLPAIRAEPRRFFARYILSPSSAIYTYICIRVKTGLAEPCGFGDIY